MGLELALYLGETRRVDIIERAVTESFSRADVVRGDDLLERLEPHIEGGLRRPLLLLLLREGVLNKVKAAPAIDGYLLSLDAERARDFFAVQRDAARSLRGASPKTYRRSRNAELVATLPARLAVGKDIPGIGSLDAAIRRLIVSASSEVWVVNPYFDHFGAASIEAPLIGRAKRGVNIRIVTRDLLLASGAGRANLEPLRWLSHRFRESGVEDKLQIRDFTKRDERSGRIQYALHSKIVLSDSKACYVGSANVTETSLRLNFELGVVLYGANVVPVRELVTHLWNVSTEAGLLGG